jgi:hypothetical protein
MRVLRSTLIIELAYHEAKSVTIKRFPTDSEIEELEFSRHKMVDDVMSTYGNEILVRIFNRSSQSFTKRISGGLWDFNEVIPEGVDIEIRMKHADSRLNGDIGKIARKLSIKHLKKPTVFQSRYSTHCQIDKCGLEDETIELFLKDFSNELGKSVDMYKITKKETKIEKIKPVPEEDWLSDKKKEPHKKTGFVSVDSLKKCLICLQLSSNLEQCEYCKEWFCREHITPKNPHKSLSSKIGHPCSAFNEKQKNIKEEKQLTEKQSNIDKKQSFWKRLKNRIMKL